jgi:Flp pilus assembly protein protease CpaA
MSLSLIVLIVVLFTFILASIEDIKKREVYDYINYAFAFFIISIAIFDSISSSSFVPVKYVGFGLLVGFAIGSILYYIGIWGGGDAKFLIGFSASSYYLMNFVTQDSYFHNLYKFLGSVFSGIFDIILNMVLDIVIVFNIILLVVIVIRFFLTKHKQEFKDIFLLFAIITFLLLGLVLDYSGFSLILLGFFSFLIIFFADEEIFNSVYFVRKKSVKCLKEGEMLDDSIKSNNISIPLSEAKFGLSKENITDINNNITDDFEIRVRHVIPYAYLIALNYIVYMFKIITIDDMNLSILGFILKFLFLSFIVGGLLAIILLLYCFIKNFRKIRYSIKKTEKITLLVLLLATLILATYNSSFWIIGLFIPLYLFIKIAKQLETLMFVKLKKVEKLTLGDWIVQDIKAGDKLIYDSSDFKLGVDEKQLAKIQKLSKKYSELKSVYVKDGLAFLPPLFVGFLIMLFI